MISLLVGIDIMHHKVSDVLKDQNMKNAESVIPPRLHGIFLSFDSRTEFINASICLYRVCKFITVKYHLLNRKRFSEMHSVTEN